MNRKLAYVAARPASMVRKSTRMTKGSSGACRPVTCCTVRRWDGERITILGAERRMRDVGPSVPAAQTIAVAHS